jgi:hypothetical protein
MKLEIIMSDFTDEITTDETKAAYLDCIEVGAENELITATRYGLHWSFKIKSHHHTMGFDEANKLAKAFRKIVAKTKKINKVLKKLKESA